MLKRFIILLAIILPLSIIGVQSGRILADDRIAQAAIAGSIWFWFAIAFLAIHRKYPRFLGFDERNPLPRLDIGFAVILFGGTAYCTAIVVLFLDGTFAELAILGIIAIAAFLGWLFRDKDLTASPDESGAETHSTLPEIPRIRFNVAGALIGMAALNATFLSVTIRHPFLFLLAMVANILVLVVICWLCRDKGERGAYLAARGNG